MEDEFIKKLKERYENGEISKETYEEILKRHENKKVEKGNEQEKENNEELGKDYKCAGMCAVPAGEYRRISVSGMLSIQGDIHAEKLFSGGMLTSNGSIYVKIYKSGGTAKIDGDLIAEYIKAGGILKAHRIEGETVKIGGILKCTELTSKNVEIEGELKANRIDGKNITLYISKSCNVNEINGAEVNIKAKKGFLRRRSGTLKASKISGDNIYIEHTHSDIVEGDNIVVRDNCIIKTVKGKHIEVSKKAKVEKIIKE